MANKCLHCGQGRGQLSGYIVKNVEVNVELCPQSAAHTMRMLVHKTEQTEVGQEDTERTNVGDLAGGEIPGVDKRR